MLCAPCSTGLLRDVEAAIRVVDVATVSGANGVTGTAAPVAAPAVARDDRSGSWSMLLCVVM